MKSLKTLIRLQKQKVDELRRKMTVLENQKAQLIAQEKSLAAELERELALASQQPEMGGFFGDFAERIRRKREQVAGNIRQVDVHIADLQNMIRDAFGELKKLEISEERRKERLKREQEAKESAQLDEVAIMQYARKGDE